MSPSPHGCDRRAAHGVVTVGHRRTVTSSQPGAADIRPPHSPPLFPNGRKARALRPSRGPPPCIATNAPLGDGAATIRTCAMHEKRAPQTKPSPLRQGAGARRSHPLRGERPAEGGVNRRSDRQRRPAPALPSVALRKRARGRLWDRPARMQSCGPRRAATIGVIQMSP